MKFSSIFDAQATRQKLYQENLLLGDHACEKELVLLCCREPSVNAVHAVRVRELCNDCLDWDFILEFSRRQRIVAFVYQTLKRFAPLLAPAQLMEKMRCDVWGQAQYNLYSSCELYKILKMLSEHGIIAVPFKGPVLTATIYHDLRMRISSDLDIFVHEADLFKAIDLLLKLGFFWKDRPENNLFEFMDETKDFLFTRDDGVTVELHWKMLPSCLPFLPENQALWDAVVSWPFLNFYVPQFSPEVTFVLICVHHGISHLFLQFSMVCDIDRFLRKFSELNWDTVLSLSRYNDCTRAILVGCCLANSILETRLPNIISYLIARDKQVQRLSSDILCWRLEKEKVIISRMATYNYYYRSKSALRNRLHLMHCLMLAPFLRAIFRFLRRKLLLAKSHWTLGCPTGRR